MWACDKTYNTLFNIQLDYTKSTSSQNYVTASGEQRYHISQLYTMQPRSQASRESLGTRLHTAMYTQLLQLYILARIRELVKNTIFEEKTLADCYLFAAPAKAGAAELVRLVWVLAGPLFRGDQYSKVLRLHRSRVRRNEHLLTTHLLAESCFLTVQFSGCARNGRLLRGLLIRSRTALELLPPPLQRCHAPKFCGETFREQPRNSRNMSTRKFCTHSTALHGNVGAKFMCAHTFICTLQKVYLAQPYIHVVHMHAEVSGYNVSYLPLATKMGKLKNIARSSKLSSHYRQ